MPAVPSRVASRGSLSIEFQDSMSRWQRWGAAIGLLLMLAYALPLFVPPPAAWPAPAAFGAGLWARVFPGVPPWWVASRLICLFVGAGLIASSTAAPACLHWGTLRTAPRRRAAANWARTAQWGAVIVALAHAASGLFAARFDRLAETIYFVFLAVPAGVFALTEGTLARRAVRAAARPMAALLLVPVLWLAVSVPTAWRSPRAANVVDMWIMVQRLEQVALGQQRVLADSASPGHSNAYMMLEGVPLVGSNRLPVTFTQLQISHFLWAVTCAVAVGMVTWIMVGPAAAIVAQAVLLFSQYVLSAPYSPGPTLIAPLCAVLLLLLIFAVRNFGSTAALVAFGAVAGFSGTEPTVALVALLLCAVMAGVVRRFPQTPGLAIGAAVLSGAAAVVPALPDPWTLATMARQYTFGHAQLAGTVTLLFGQRTISEATQIVHAARPGLFDLPLGALLSPFAIARTPMRLWGDALLDPAGTVLTTIGLVVCALQVARKRSSASALMLVVLATALAQAFTSSGDAISHNRLAAALVPLAVLSALGFETLRLAFAATVPATALAATIAALVAAGGFTIFDRVNREILPASWLATSLEALGTGEPNADAVFLEHGLWWLYVDRIAALLPAHPEPSRTVVQLDRLEAQLPDTGRGVYFWSPGLETDTAVSCLICERWPEAAVYTLTDKPGLFRAFAASPYGATWHPRLPTRRWTVSSCEPLCREYGTPWLTPPQPEGLHCGGTADTARADDRSLTEGSDVTMMHGDPTVME